MNCIKCAGTLIRVTIEDVEVDRCDGCGGIWFDAGELQRVRGKRDIELLRSKARPRRDDDERRARCPRCQGEGLLVQVASWDADIHIDTCAVCGGQWLDAGELELLRGEGGPFGRLVERLRRLVS